MGVLPAASKGLIPEPYRDLMTDVGSPIIDFYPKDFDLDLNGKKQDWEAVVLIPFIDENRLISALQGMLYVWVGGWMGEWLEGLLFSFAFLFSSASVCRIAAVC